MTIKEAILKALDESSQPLTYQDVTKYILENNLYEGSGLTLDATISAQLGDFIRKNDARVGRIKEGRSYFYYLTKNEVLSEVIEAKEKVEVKRNNKADFSERDLHPLFVSYLKSKGIYAKTILHEESKNSKDDTQKWAHPDIVGVKFAKFKSEASIRLLKTFESQILFQSSFRELDYQTIDKLCHINTKYKEFIEQIITLNTDEKHLDLLFNEFNKKCDPFYEKDEEIAKYCREKNIPFEQE
jgi:hypothetical protein